VVTDKIVVLTTCRSQEQGAQIARQLIEHRLAACAHLLPAGRSFYRWQGEIANEQEITLLIKTKREIFPKLRDEIIRLHSYAIPEVIALPIVDGSSDYLNWLDGEIAL
jgi:periplasmic divalent cation tolerance protein